MDLSKKLVINTNQERWVESPAKGVRRITLERENEESGHTTSIVEYFPGSSFKEHSHPLGEEIFVLQGTFSDENGDYPAGTYIRNPPGSCHSPFSKDGCVLFVKLQQMNPNDQKSVTINSLQTPWLPGHGGLKVMPLFNFDTENVALVKWPEGEEFLPHSHHGGEEIFVISGTFIDEFGEYPQGTWIRSPHLSKHHPYVKQETVVWVKTGHLLK